MTFAAAQHLICKDADTVMRAEKTVQCVSEQLCARCPALPLTFSLCLRAVAVHPRLVAADEALHKAGPHGVYKDRAGDLDRIRDHGVHWLLRQAHLHPDQQHHRWHGMRMA